MASVVASTATHMTPRCSEQVTFANALTAMTSESANLRQTGWAKFLNLSPNGKGYGSPPCGVDISILATPVAGKGGVPQLPTLPDTPLPAVPVPDPSKYVYEYSAKTSFTVKPLIAMSGVPFVNNVPGLGKPVEIVFTAARAAEHVAGLATAPKASGNGISPPDLQRYLGSGPPPTWLGPGVNPPYGWRNPGAWGMIPPGMTVVSYDIWLVPGNSVSWVSSGLSITSTQHVYIDTHADGIWQGGFNPPTYDANGYVPPNICNAVAVTAQGLSPSSFDWRLFGNAGTPNFSTNPDWAELVGFVGSGAPNIVAVSPPTIGVAACPYALPYKGFFVLGDNSYQPSPGTGLIQAVQNDNIRPGQNMGSQAVRLMVLQ